MTHKEIFNNAKWIKPKEDMSSAIFRGTFELKDKCSTKINICGLGYFILYINSKRVSCDELVPAYSDYIKRDREKMNLIYPLNDIMDNRVYCLSYDISEYIKKGTNVIGVMLGGGYFHQTERKAEGNMDYGNIRLCYLIKTEENEFASGENTLYKQGFIKKSSLFFGEEHDYNGFDYNWNTENADLNGWKTPEICKDMKTEFYIQSCNTDKIIRSFKPLKLKDFGEYSVYDAGLNLSGYAVVQCDEPNQKVEIKFSELLSADGNLDPLSAGWNQTACDTFITDGKTKEFFPRFLWHGFRYFSLTNNANPTEVREVHADIPVSGDFKCSDQNLNWLFDTFVHTQLSNMHSGVPSDCPHRERLGYTGDGRLCAAAAMLSLDSKDFFRKWIYDIADCQDKTTGHVQHTAPFAGGGGGPAGWGGAIISVPYTYAKISGDTDMISEMYPNMLKYRDYMESRCEEGLVVREEKKGWCLGDWCTPQKIKLPEAFANTCMYVDLLEILRYCEKLLDKNTGKTESLISFHRQSLIKKYREKDGTFLGGLQGAEAFAYSCGIADGNTLDSLVRKYEKLGMYDTGIFGTYILNEVLFKNGKQNLAYSLLSGDGEVSFSHMRKNGATTLWENWNGADSNNHPMFGASVRFLFEYILGITQTEDSYGYKKAVIAPANIEKLNFAKGHIKTPSGKISVEYKKEKDNITFVIVISGDTEAVFKYGETEKNLSFGENHIKIPLVSLPL